MSIMYEVFTGTMADTPDDELYRFDGKNWPLVFSLIFMDLKIYII